MEIINISKALKLNIGNKYQVETLLKAKEEFYKINKFYPCECFCEVCKISDNLYSLQTTNIFLINDVCKISINYNIHTKKYSIYYNTKNERFKNLDFYDIKKIRQEFKKPQNIGVLTTKKIEKWVKYEQDVYLALVKKDKKLTDHVENFLKTLIGENIVWNNTYNKISGEIIKNGVEYSFSIENGCITQNIKLSSVPYSANTLERFRLLSDNKLNRVNKLKRILNEN